jgi:serine/threonine protein kinase
MLKYSKRLREAREEEAMSEVQQLYRAQHAHIVRLVGTYIIDHELAILTYPRAEWSLEQFLTRPPTDFIEEERRSALQRFLGCLARVMDFIHSCPIKHMDIKPQNILVRDTRRSSIDSSQAFQVYLTDFGSSKFYPSAEDTETDSPTPYTRIYAAKEVLLDDFRGLPADIFSMGCVFAEILATAIDFVQDSSPREALLDACGTTEGIRKPFCTRVKQVRQWLQDLPIDESHTTFLAGRHWISLMLSDDPQERPSARELVNDTRLIQQCSSCDRATPEAFERIPQG